MMDAVEGDGQMIGMEWVGTLDGRLTGLVQLSEFHQGESSSDSYSEHTQRLVDIDAATGRISNPRPVVPEET
jgi:hypothetical protein